MLTHWTHKIDMPLAEDKKEKWKPYGIKKGSTRNLDLMGCHVSVLSPGHSPHLPHSHEEEEILIVLEGEAELIISNDETIENARIHKITTGSFVYYPARQHHTIRNSGESPLTYLLFKWMNESGIKNNIMQTTIVDYHDKYPRTEKPFSAEVLFDQQTLYLDKFHCHLSKVNPGGGYLAHVDKHDVVIITLSGQVKTLNKTLDPISVVFYPGGIKHGLKNHTNKEAKYLVFEFHGPDRKKYKIFDSMYSKLFSLFSTPRKYQ